MCGHSIFRLAVYRERREAPDSLCNVQVSAGGCGVQGDPALVVRLVDSSSVLHQERHHVHVVVYAGLKRER